MIIKMAPPVEDHRRPYWRDGSRPSYFTVWMGDDLEHRKFNNMDEADGAFRQALVDEFGEDLGQLVEPYLDARTDECRIVRFEYDTRAGDSVLVIFTHQGDGRSAVRVDTDKVVAA